METLSGQLSLQDVIDGYRSGRYAREQVAEYIRAWNSPRKHFTIAYISFMGGIRQAYPETKADWNEIRRYAEEFAFADILAKYYPTAA